MDRIRIARESGLDSMAESVLDGSLSEASLLPTFDRSYFEAMRSVIFANNPEIKRFDGEVHSRLVESFRKLDRFTGYRTPSLGRSPGHASADGEEILIAKP
jgi:hypothetical protein